MQNIEMLRFGMQNIEILLSRKLSLLPFLIRSLSFSQGILDYLDNLTVTQIRKLFSMLSTLAFTNQQDGGLIQVICNKNGARAWMYCRQDKARQCFIWSLIQSYVHRLGVDGGGWGRWGLYSPKFYTGRLFPEVQPLTLLYTIFDRKVALSYTFYWQTVPLSQTWFRTVLHPFFYWMFTLAQNSDKESCIMYYYFSE